MSPALPSRSPTLTRGIVVAVAILVGLATIAALVAVTFALRVPISSDRMRRAVTEALAERLDAEVELNAFRVRFLPRVHAEGANLTIRHRGRRDVPPLISVKSFSVQAGLIEIWRRRIAHVRLDGLEIHIPPGGASIEGAGTRDVDDDEDSDADAEVIVTELVAADAKLVIIPRNKAKPPKTWEIHALRMESVSTRTPMPFQAELTNAVPPGQIEVVGSFGPWQRTEPGETPLGGQFTFENADLGVFKGISGTLSSKGAFGGALNRIEVQGETDTPDFTLAVSGNPVPLKTKYHAVVDGTDGDTRLERVDASVLDTSIVAIGEVVHVEGVKGRQVDLDVTIDGGRLEDVLRMAVRAADPPMTGGLDLETTLVLPPGDRDVVEKLQLNGAFTIDAGRFTDAKVQQQVNELSVRARGRKNPTAKPPRVESDFSGTFALGDMVLSLSKVTFDVPGAIVELKGQYLLQPERIDFRGNLFMEARVSQTTSGFKSLLLRIIDPLFRRDGQTVVPLRISGTRSNPSFGLDLGRVFRRD
jgi:hypothetical protein